MKKLTQSKTTQNVTVAGLGTGSALLVVLNLIRSFAPDLLPWDTAYDLEINTVLMAVVIPVVSRAIAFFRNPEKKEGG